MATEKKVELDVLDLFNIERLKQLIREFEEHYIIGFSGTDNVWASDVVIIERDMPLLTEGWYIFRNYWWDVTAIRFRFVKEDGVWRLEKNIYTIERWKARGLVTISDKGIKLRVEPFDVEVKVV